MNPPKRSAELMTSFLGDCELTLRRPINYEPPMYLFPELLPRVPEGTPPLSVSDAIADAIDVEASSLDIAALCNIPQIELREGTGDLQRGDANEASSASNSVELSDMHIIASLLASNRLQIAGLTADMLKSGGFSSRSIVEKLRTLIERARLSSIEAKAIMSPTFLNLLNWRSLTENESRYLSNRRKREPESELPDRRVRPRQELVEETEIALLQPSNDPWSSDVDLTPGVFVAAGERDVERRNEALVALSNVLSSSWRSLRSIGIQTDRFVPGSINETSPYADPLKIPGGTMDVEQDLGWKPQEGEEDSKSNWLLRVTSSITSSTKVFPMKNGIMNFGRNAGVTSAVYGSVTNVHVGLSSFTAHPEFISPHHFSLMLLPAQSTCPDDNLGTATQQREGSIEESGDGGTRCLWLMNYGRNGTRVIGKQWTLGDMVRLDIGDVLQPTDDIRITITASSQNGEEESVEVGNVAEVVVKKEPNRTLEE
ncbi:uncharacterized protein TM35_000044400 [Trypanosoma theileri]|uniref:FHA domain-containing protein n=1 Tax=Trypanosoma theileri TaxID=67003 RepID=A0A1X0P5K7_9TRYP|nr:uncharacterized protein TM35_000044400 [Trypanosoma theileri]ORC92226.1 hypothetical protein TM35_000044400 [Trypanosoma theileri]